jgi:hypothetical protein
MAGGAVTWAGDGRVLRARRRRRWIAAAALAHLDELDAVHAARRSSSTGCAAS